MRHILAEHPSVECPMNEIAVSERDGIISQHPPLDSVARVDREHFSFLNEGPIRLDPDRISDLRLNAEFSAGGFKAPTSTGVFRVGQGGPAAGRYHRFVDDLLSPLQPKAVLGRVDHRINSFRGEV